MKIEIDLADLGFHYDEDGDAVRNKSLDDAIVSRAAEIVANHIIRQHDLARALQAKADQLIGDAITEALSKPIQRSSAWGEKKGEPTTVLEIVRERLEGFLNSSPGNRRDRYDKTPQNLNEIIEDATSNVLGRELQDVVKQAKEQIRTHIFDKALAAAVAALSKDK